MVNGLIADSYSQEFAEDPEELNQGKRHWWCPNCGAVFHRNHNEKGYKFCFNCNQRDAVHIEMDPVGPGSEDFA